MSKKIKSNLNLDNYTVTEIKTTYTKKGSKWIETEKQEKIINSEYYNNVINSKSFFNTIGTERHIKNYTVAGYIVTEINSYSPDKATKINRYYKIDR